MNPEIEKLIDFALADGVISDKEREIIRNKAEKLGEDPDEAEMILDAKLAMKGNQATTPPPTASNPPPINTPTAASGPPPINVPPANSTSNKVGNIQTCPACGATVNAMELNCSECRHEFRNVNASKHSLELKKQLDQLESKVRKRHETPKGFFNKLVNSIENIDSAGRSKKERIIRGDINSEQALFLNNYQIESSKEGIKEILIFATGILPQFEIKLSSLKEENKSAFGYDLDVKAEINGLEDIITAWKTCVSKVISMIALLDIDKEERETLLRIAHKVI